MNSSTEVWLRRTLSTYAVAILTVALLVSTNFASSTVTEDGSTPGGPLFPNPVPSLHLSLSPNVLEAVVTSSQNGPVSFNGTATVEQPRFMTSTVTLSATCIWTPIVSPSTLEFDGPGEKPFHATVIVPPETSSLEVGQVIVSGTCRSPGMPVAVAQANAVVTVAQYYDTAFNFTTRTRELHRGESDTIEIRITNLGNGPAVYELTVSVQDDDITATLSSVKIELMAGEEATVFLNVSAGKEASFGEYTVIVTIEEVSGGRRSVGDFQFMVAVRSKVTPFQWITISAILVVVIVATVLFMAWKRGRLQRFRRRTVLPE